MEQPAGGEARAGDGQGGEVMDVRDALVQRLTDRFLRFRTVFERFDDATAMRERVGAKWNVRDLAGHMFYWTGEAARRLPEIAAGGKAPAYDLDRINDEVFRRNRRMSFVMLLPQLRAAEEGLLEAVRRLPPAGLLDSPARAWIDLAVLEHYDHHWPGLKGAAARLEGAG
jgi:hypothetical protein